MMDTKIKKLWVDALRSGEFKQTTLLLKDASGYCCLGVLCETLVRNNLVPEGISITQDSTDAYCDGLHVEVNRYGEVVDDSWEQLPGALLTHLGISNGDMNALVGMNDGGDGPDGHEVSRSFAEIADVIEKTL